MRRTLIGRLAAVAAVVRAAAMGGRPPAAGECDADAVAELREIPYGADYVFFKATGS